MEKINVDVGPDGLVTSHFTDEITGKLITRTEQDIEANVAYATALRNSDEYWKQGVKRGWAHAAHIPQVVVVELMQNGCNIFDPGVKARHIVATLKRLGKDHLLTTRKNV